MVFLNGNIKIHGKKKNYRFVFDAYRNGKKYSTYSITNKSNYCSHKFMVIGSTNYALTIKAYQGRKKVKTFKQTFSKKTVASFIKFAKKVKNTYIGRHGSGGYGSLWV